MRILSFSKFRRKGFEADGGCGYFDASFWILKVCVSGDEGDNEFFFFVDVCLDDGLKRVF